MRELIVLFLIMAVCMGTCSYLDSLQDPDEVGMHLEYNIKCEGGFKYKSINGSYILMLNSDGTPLRCNQKRH